MKPLILALLLILTFLIGYLVGSTPKERRKEAERPVRYELVASVAARSFCYNCSPASTSNRPIPKESMNSGL